MVKWSVVGVCVVACGGGGSGSDDPSVDAPKVGGDAANADAAIPRRSGFVLIGRDQSSPQGYATATLYQANPPVETNSGTVGPCVRTVFGAPTPTVSAGAIAITGTTSAVTLTPTSPGTMIAYPSTPATFAAGASITVTAPGTAEYPAFTASAIAPSAVAGWTPPAFINTAAGYTATWTASNGMEVSVVVFSFDALDRPMFVRCRVPDTGTYTIPPAAFDLMPSAGHPAQVSIIRANRVDTPTVKLELTISILATDIPYN